MTGKQALIGCGIGCGAIVVIGVALFAGLAYWVTRPGELIEPERLLAEDTTGYVAWTLRLEDPGTAGFVTALVERAQELRRQRNRALPEPLGTILGAVDRNPDGQMRQLFPLTVLWTSSPAQAGAGDLRLLSVSLPAGGNRLVMLDWILGLILSRNPDAVHDHAGERIYHLQGDRGGNVTFFLRGSDLFFVTDVETARRAIDRLAGPSPHERAPTALDRLYAQAPAEAALRGALSNGQGELERLWRDLVTASGEGAAWNEVAGLVVSGGLEPDGAFDGVLELIGADADWAAERSEPVVAAIRAWLDEAPLEIESSSEVTGERVRIAVRVSDLARVLQHAE
jgi:hypothetical protein